MKPVKFNLAKLAELEKRLGCKTLDETLERLSSLSIDTVLTAYEVATGEKRDDLPDDVRLPDLINLITPALSECISGNVKAAPSSMLPGAESVAEPGIGD